MITIKLETFQGKTYIQLTEQNGNMSQTHSREFAEVSEATELVEMLKNLVRGGE